MGEEADWRGLEEEEGTLSPPAAEDDQREMWERHSELSEAMGEDAEPERGCPDGASPGPEQDKRLPEGDRLLGNEPGAGNEPGPEPAPDSQPEDGAQSLPQGGRHRHRRLFCNSSAKEEARSLQTTVGVVGKRSGRTQVLISGFCKQISEGGCRGCRSASTRRSCRKSPSTRPRGPSRRSRLPCTTSTSARRSKAADACACR